MGKRFAIILILFIIILQSCEERRYVYAPQPPVIAYFTKKGESNLAAYASKSNTRGKGFNKGYDLQGGYAISNNLAVIASYYQRRERDSYHRNNGGNPYFIYYDTSTINYKRSLWSVGLGYFSPDRDKIIWFSCYGGVGYGNFSLINYGTNNNTFYIRSLEDNFFKFYIQPGLYFTEVKNFRFSLVSKFTIAKFNKPVSDYTNAEKGIFRLETLGVRNSYFIEPSFDIQYIIPNCPWLKLNGDITLTLNPVSNVSARGSNVSIGLSIDVSKF